MEQCFPPRSPSSEEVTVGFETVCPPSPSLSVLLPGGVSKSVPDVPCVSHTSSPWVVGKGREGAPCVLDGGLPAPPPLPRLSPRLDCVAVAVGGILFHQLRQSLSHYLYDNSIRPVTSPARGGRREKADN